MKPLIALLCLFLFAIAADAQITGPDTVCLNTTATFQGPARAAGNYTWYLDTVQVNQPLSAATVIPGNNQLNGPAGFSMNLDNGTWYGFVSNDDGNIARFNYGSSPLNTPVITSLGNMGVLTSTRTEDIVILKDGNTWYGFVTDDTKLVRLNFGTSLANVPTVTSLPFPGALNFAVQLTIRKTGNQWVGFAGNYSLPNITRFDFGTSLTNIPTATLLPNYNLLSSPCYFTLYQQNDTWYMLVTNIFSNNLIRYVFGQNLQNNAPTATSLGNPGGLLDKARGISLLKDCNELIAVVENEPGEVLRLNFGNDITNTPAAASLGSLGMGIYLSKLFPFWYDHSLYFLTSSFTANAFYRLKAFTTTANNTYKYSDSTFTNQFTTPGIHHLTLHLDQGQSAGPGAWCKDVFVTQFTPSVSISVTGNVLTATGSYGKYQWYRNGVLIPGATGPVYTASQGGSYSVHDSTVCGLATDSYDLSLGIGTSGVTPMIRVFPNPAAGPFTIAGTGLGSGEREIRVRIYHMTGALLWEKTVAVRQGTCSLTVEDAALASGVYQLELATNTGARFYRKISLQ